MSSESRSSSAVRNLRSIFENKASETSTPDSRGRSPNGLGSDKENNHQSKSKVRASFVPVELVPSMAASVEHASGRRGSFGEADADMELRKVVSGQQEILGVPEGAVESMPPSVAATPLRPPNEGRLGYDDTPSVQKIESEPENPDKPVTGAEEEPGDMKPADLADEDAVSGGQALPPVAEDMRSTTKSTSSTTIAAKKADSQKTPTSTKPPAISTKSVTKPSSGSVKSPTSQPKTPLSGQASSSTESPAAKRPGRSSLTAPTAASMARSGAASDKTKASPASHARPREVTRPVNLPSHLTAPTASSKAKHDPAPTATSTSTRASLSSRPKPQVSSTKPAARSSLAAGQRAESRGSQRSGRRSLAPAEGSFLDRMTRPTAASSGRTAEKVVAKSPPRTKPSSKPKVNGHISKNIPKSTSTDVPTEPANSIENGHDAHGTGDQPGLSFAENATTLDDAIATVDGQATGNETPDHHPDDLADGILEATPAGIGGEETIR